MYFPFKTAPLGEVQYNASLRSLHLLLNKFCADIFPYKFMVNEIYQPYNFCFTRVLKCVLSLCFIPGSDCSRNFTSPSGLIESPGFPDKYPHNLECSFIIIVPSSMDVTLTFLTFDLENDPLPGGEGDCKYDWLEVWDGLPGGETNVFLHHDNDDDRSDKRVYDVDGNRNFVSQYTELGENGVYSALPTSLLTEVEYQLF